MNDERLASADWALSTEIRVAWGDMDAFGHVNDTVYLRWFETARIEWLAQSGASAPLPDDLRARLGCTALAR